MMMMKPIKATSHQVCCIVAKFLGYVARPIPYIRTLRYKATVDATNTPLPGSFVLETSYKRTKNEMSRSTFTPNILYGSVPLYHVSKMFCRSSLL